MLVPMSGSKVSKELENPRRNSPRILSTVSRDSSSHVAGFSSWGWATFHLTKFNPNTAVEVKCLQLKGC